MQCTCQVSRIPFTYKMMVYHKSVTFYCVTTILFMLLMVYIIQTVHLTHWEGMTIIHRQCLCDIYAPHLYDYSQIIQRFWHKTITWQFQISLT